MKKRILAMLVALSMIVAATGCGKSYKIGENGEVYNDYIKVNKWKGFEIEKVEPMAVTDEDVNLSIESDLQTLSTWVEVTGRGAQNGDQITLDFVGKLDGVAFEKGSGSDTFILGEGDYLEDFQKGIVGHKMGETFDVPLTFPENYGGDLGGKAVVFTMTLNKVEEKVIPELSDEIVSQLRPDAKTVEEYKQLMKADLEKSNKEEAEYWMNNSLFNLLMEQCEMIEYPEDELEELIAVTEKFYREQLEYAVYYDSGMTLEAYMEATGYTEEELLGGTYEDYAKDILRIKYCLELVLDVEEISHTEEDYENFLKEEAEKQGVESIKEIEESLDSANGPYGAKRYFLQMKVADFLWENCTIVEPAENEPVTE